MIVLYPSKNDQWQKSGVGNGGRSPNSVQRGTGENYGIKDRKNKSQKPGKIITYLRDSVADMEPTSQF
jgi:hypothetical protein